MVLGALSTHGCSAEGELSLHWLGLPLEMAQEVAKVRWKEATDGRSARSVMGLGPIGLSDIPTVLLRLSGQPRCSCSPLYRPLVLHMGSPGGLNWEYCGDVVTYGVPGDTGNAGVEDRDSLLLLVEGKTLPSVTSRSGG